jgi:GMP synthase (glutamine-hydrolysing)
MVSERLAWSEYVAGWLRAAARQGRLPVLGICYGHQLLAHALGGRVDFHPQGREMGTIRISKTAAALDDPLCGDLPPGFKAQASHRQSVMQLPPGAEVLASNEFEPHHAVRFNDSMWGVQFHPEFSADVMLHYLAEREADLVREGLDVASIRSQVESTPEATRVLANFGRMLYTQM